MTQSFDLDRLLHPAVLVFLIPITAILVGGAIAITKLWIHHCERAGSPSGARLTEVGWLVLAEKIKIEERRWIDS